MASLSVVVNSALCFIVSKYGKISVKTLKSVLLDFDDVAILSVAKEQLVLDLDKLDLPTKRPYVPSRRDGDGRLEKKVNDILLLLTFTDKQKATDKLFKYVCNNPDDLPSLRLYDGDMSVIMKKFENFDKRIDHIGSMMAAIMKDMQQLIHDGVDWAAVTSTPQSHRNVSSAASASEVYGHDDGDGTITIVRSRKRHRQSAADVQQRQTVSAVGFTGSRSAAATSGTRSTGCRKSCCHKSSQSTNC